MVMSSAALQLKKDTAGRSSLQGSLQFRNKVKKKKKVIYMSVSTK